MTILKRKLAEPLSLFEGQLKRIYLLLLIIFCLNSFFFIKTTKFPDHLDIYIFCWKETNDAKYVKTMGKVNVQRSRVNFEVKSRSGVNGMCRLIGHGIYT